MSEPTATEIADLPRMPSAQEVAEELHKLQTAPPAQITEEQLKKMSWQEIEKARKDGLLADLLAPRPKQLPSLEEAPVPSADQGAMGGQGDALDRVHRMSPDAIVEEYRLRRQDMIDELNAAADIRRSHGRPLR